MTNPTKAATLLRKAGYRSVAISDHTVVVYDPVRCSSGSLKWEEEREVAINVANNLDRVHHFIEERR